MAVTISIRMPDDVHAQYETLARATGRTRNELMVEALRRAAEQQLREIALVQEGLAQSRAGLGIPIEDVVARFKAEGMLPPSFQLDDEQEQARP
ncbi:MAG TPA: ribbon-helix-helix protein, CopG family [Chloroflexota bacterium]|nr:ribbon-helix-helix protein, CopG family [Chloroflexota bacterium]